MHVAINADALVNTLTHNITVDGAGGVAVVPSTCFLEVLVSNLGVDVS
jgi:hypothetical protein